MKQNNAVKRVAIGGIITAIAVIFMFLTSFLDIAIYIAPMLAGLILIPLSEEFGRKTALTAYAATSILSLILINQKELVFMYIFFFGYYASIRDLFSAIKPKILFVLAKLLLFNISVVSAYLILIKIIAPPELVNELKESGAWFGIALLLIGNLIFIIYDKLIGIVKILYIRKIRPQLHIK